MKNLIYRFFKINLDLPADRNAYYLVMELFWAAVLGSAATFNAAFAVRLGANNVEVSLLTSIPALLAVLISIPAGRFLEQRERRTPWVLGSLAFHRTGYLLAALVPWLDLPFVSPGMLLVLILVVNTSTAHFFNVGWIPLLADVVGADRRAAVFTARNIVNSVTNSLFGFLFGQWLSSVAFPINYQAMYVFGWIASMVSMYFLLKMQVPDSYKTVKAAVRAKTLRQQVGALRDAFDAHPQFLHITRNTLLHGIGIWLASPLYVLYFVRELNASDAWLGLNGMIASACTIAGFSFWRWRMTRWGESRTLKRTIAVAGLYPVLVGLVPALTPILFLSAFNGLAVPGINLSHFNLLLRTIPAESRPSYTALYTTIMNIGAFVCPLISVAIAGVIGLGPTLVVAGLLSVIGSTSFWWWPVVLEDE